MPMPLFDDGEPAVELFKLTQYRGELSPADFAARGDGNSVGHGAFGVGGFAFNSG